MAHCIFGFLKRGFYILRKTGRPVRFEIAGTARGTDYAIECAFTDGEVRASVRKGEMTFERKIPLSGDVLLFDNNHLGLLSLLLSRFELKEGAAFRVKAFHPSSLSVLPFDIAVGKKAKITVAGKERETLEVTLSIAATRLTLFVTADGLIVRDEEAGGKLVVDLASEE